MKKSSSLSPLMTILLGPEKNLLAFKKYLIHIRKIKVMVGTSVRELQYKSFVNPPTRNCRDNKNKLSIEEWLVGLICMKNGTLWSTVPAMKLKVKWNVDHRSWSAKWRSWKKGEKIFEHAYSRIWRKRLSVETDLCMSKWMKMRMWQSVKWNMVNYSNQ